MYHYARATTTTPEGTLLHTFGATQTGGDNRGVEVNEARNAVYVVDAEHSDVDVFGLDGTYRFSFGSEGTGPGQFTGGGRQLAIDDEGNVWVADFGGFETQKFTWNGTPLLTAPTPAEKPPVGLLGQPRDVAIEKTSGDVWVADAWNQRFQRFTSTGQSLGSWGARGPGGPFQMNYPRSIGINPANRQIWVANERGHHIQVYNYPTSQTASPTYVAQIGQIGSDDTDPGHFRWPVDIEFYQPPTGNMRAIIGDRMAASVKIFDAVTRQEILMIPDGANHGLAVDPATGNIYVCNSARNRIDVYDQTGLLLFSFGSSGTAPGPVPGHVRGRHQPGHPLRLGRDPLAGPGVRPPGQLPGQVGRELRGRGVRLPRPGGHGRRRAGAPVRRGLRQRPDPGVRPQHRRSSRTRRTHRRPRSRRRRTRASSRSAR